MLAPGQIFASRYRVRRCIAEGGMGAIFEAEHVATERRVALKLLFPHIMTIASARQKFELEAKVSARVNSPYIVSVLDAGFDDGSKSPYLVMELLEGQTLAARVRERGPLTADEALRLLEQVAAGLDAAHGYREPGGVVKPIVHRDLKPENLFLARQHDGSVVVKILDYGIAKVLCDTTNVSQEVRGTPLFMAFEQITAGTLSPQTDVWALGLIAYYTLTGARYWRSAERQGVSVQSLFAEILTLPLQAPSSRLREQSAGVELPPAFDPWLLRCIDRDPGRRFASAGAAIEELSRVYARASLPVSPAPSALVRPSREAQALAVTDVATPRASSLASLPALSSTRHRRTLRAPAATSPLRWAALGAAGSVLVIGAIAWLVLRGYPPSGAVVGVSPPRRDAVPVSAVAAARPASRPAAPASAPRAVASEPSSAPSSPVSGRREPMAGAPRIRIAPLDETPPPAAPGASPDGGGARLAGASAGAAAAEAAALTASSASPFVSAAPSAAPRPAAGAVAADDTPRATSPVVPAPAEPPPRKRERRRRPGSGEAYETR